METGILSLREQRAKVRLGLAILILLAAFQVPGAAQGPDQKGKGKLKLNLLEIEAVKRLVLDLNDEDPAVANKAFVKLRELGPSFIDIWHNWLGLNGRRALLLECQLMDQIQAKCGARPVRVNGCEFLASIDRKWKIPRSEEKQPIALTLKITNHSEKASSFQRLGFEFHLLDSDGKFVNSRRGRDRVNQPWFSPELASGNSLAISDFGASLHRSLDGKVSLTGEDGTGEFYSYRDLQPARYYFWFTYACEKSVAGTPLPPEVWRGRVVTPPLAVELK